MNEAREPEGAHLVGSVPLGGAEEVFRRCAAALGSRLRRLPDGELWAGGEWVGWQRPVFAGHPDLVSAGPASSWPLWPQHRLRDGVDPTALRFGALGYAERAVASFGAFRRLQHAGAVPAACRFQVNLFTPLTSVLAFVVAEDRDAVEAVYREALLREVRGICDAIPAESLALQWDVAGEVFLAERWLAPASPSAEGDLDRDLAARLVGLGQAVPEGVELGYHLCYGDDDHRHLREPADAGTLVELANALASGLTRPLDWLHLPVPRQAPATEHLAPLAGLALHPGTELYLGLVHLGDGITGAEARVAAAFEVVGRFGVSAPCGFGRQLPETILDLLQLHALVSAPVR